MTWTVYHKCRLPPYVRSCCTVCHYVLWMTVCCQYVSTKTCLIPFHHPHTQTDCLTHNAGRTFSDGCHTLSFRCGQLRQDYPAPTSPVIKIHHGSHRVGPLAGPGSFEIRQQISFLTPFQFKDSSLAPSRRPGMVMVIAWQWNRQKVQRNLAIQKKMRPCGDERWRWKKKQEGERDGKI